MSLSKLGNAFNGAKGILEIFNAVNGQTDTTLLQSAADAMADIFEKHDADSTIKALRRLGLEGDSLKTVLTACKMSTDDIDKALKTTGKTGTSFVSKLKTGFEGLAGTLGLTSKALLGWAGGITAIIGILTAVHKIQEKMYQNAQDGARTYTEQTASIEKYQAEIESLKTALASGNLSHQEAYDARVRLLEIQDDLVSAYGTEAAGLDLLTMSATQATNALNDLNAAQAKEYLIGNKTVINNAEDAMESIEKHTLGSVWTGIGSPDTYGTVKRRIQEIVDKYEHAFLDVRKDAFGNETTTSIVIEANAEDAKKTVVALAADLKDLQNELALQGIDMSKVMSLESIESQAEHIVKKTGEITDKYGEIYETANLAKIAEDSGYSSLMREMEAAQKSYTDAALVSYNSEEERAAAVANSLQQMINLKQRFEDMDFGDDLGVMDIFAKFAKSFDDTIKKEDFRLDITATINGGTPSDLASDVMKHLDAFADKDGTIDPASILNAGLGRDSWGKSGGKLMSELSDQERAYLNLQAALAQYGYTVEEAIPLLQQWGIIQKSVSEDTTSTIKSYADTTTALTSLKSELGAINGAISEQGYSGNLSVDTYNSLIAISKDYADCIDYQNGALQLNAEKANILFEAKSELKKAEIELQKITEATKWKENADEIARLTKEYDGLDPAIKSQIENLKKENDGIEANLVGYDLQIAAIEELTSAYGRWKAVSESDNSDSMYKDIQNAYKAIKEAQKTGQTGVGNVVYQAAVELLVPDGEDVKKYMSTLQKYIMDGSNGLSNFINDMVTNELMDRSGSEVKMKMGVTMEQICNTMKITPDMAKAIFNALEMYDFDFHWTDEDFNINTDDAMTELKAAQEEMNKTIAKINEMKEAGATVDLATGVSLDDLEKKYAEQKSQVDKLMNSATGNAAENTVEYTITANTEGADTALDAIKGKLEEILKKIEDVFKKKLGDLGGENTLSILNNVLNTLRNINAYKIADKTFTVTQYTTTTGTKPYGSISSHDQNIKNDTSAHAAVASGTKHADAGIALVGDEYSYDGSPKPELIITDGAAYVAGQNGPEFVNLKDGDQVVPASETERILQRNPDASRGVVPAFATGAGGFLAGSLAEQRYLEEQAKKKAEEKKKAEAAAKQKASAQKKEAQSSGTSAYWTSQPSTSSTTNSNKDTSAYWTSDAGKGVEIAGGGSAGSLKNPGSGGSGGSGGSDSSDSSSTTKEKSAFEKEYDSRNHLLAMERADYEEYIDWLEGAYKDAYNKGEIELEDFYRYEQEVHEGRKELFQDSIGDIEHKIKALERDPGNETQIINYYNQIISKIDTELAAARARGLNDDDDYVQELLEQKWDYADEIKDIQDEITENAKDAVEDLIDYRMDMLKQDLENERDAIGDKLDTLRDFYDKQKEMLQDVYDEEKYLEEQSEKRKSVDDIKAEMEELKFNDSAAAQKRLDELREELLKAEKELSDFEKDHALNNATDLLDKMYEQQESQMQSEMDALEEKLNDPNALYNQALRDIQNNTLALYEEMVAYNNKYGSGNPEDIYTMWDEADKSLDAYFKTMGESYKNILLVDAYKPTGYSSGTSHATPGIHELFEGNKDEYVYTTKDGKRYRMFSGLGDKVLNASATDFLYKFANNGETFISNMLNGLVSAIGNVGKPAQQIQLSTGDIIVQGNASADTVSAIRRAQRENVDYILREFQRLNR